ncbi:hypothetical protein [Flavobacterium tiangeerense]|uniref:hypothetical protein n=1 Tax=Flavobacterium tiangeerense TaxID=459471 RepID=UPI001ABEF29B|nr:hypothetical protein [Flavobacterium tiangeerense]
MILKDAMNTYNPAIEVIQNKGFKISIVDYEENFDWKVYSDENEFIASDPLRLLGLIIIYENMGENWNDFKENHYDKILKIFYSK